MAMALGTEIVQASATATAAFCASNLDDIVLLLLLFSGARGMAGRWPVVAGQYLGFGLLVGASLLGYLGGHHLPTAWIGLLGLVPIGLGVSRFLDRGPSSPEGWSPNLPSAGDPPAPESAFSRLWLGVPVSPILTRIVAVAGLTIANGGDNVGLYMPLFAHASTIQLATTLVLFFVLVGVWCLVAWRLVSAPGVAALITRHGQPAVPWVLIGIGGLILLQRHTFSDRPLAVITLAALLAMALTLLRQLQQQLPAAAPLPTPLPAADLSVPLR